MSGWKTALLLVLLLAVLWWLYPSRQLGPAAEQAEDVVEIVYMGPGGPIAGALADAVKAFEKWSRDRHAQDPSRPSYRVVSGQNAARDQVADPTRFLVSVAGGSSPDVIWFDRFAVTEWAARGAFIPLDDFVARDGAAYAAGRLAVEPPRAEAYFAPCWNETKYRNPLTGEEHVYAIPISVDNRALYYNLDRLQQAELVDAAGRPRPPATWAELAWYSFELTQWDPPPPPAPAGWDKAKARETRYQLMLALLQARWEAGQITPPDQWDLTETHYYNWALSESWVGVRPKEFSAEEREYAARLAEWAAKRKLKRLGFAPNYGNAWLYMYGWMNGAAFISADGQSCVLNEPAVCQALGYMKLVYDLAGGGLSKGLITEGYEQVSGFQRGFSGGELDPFIQGSIAMKIDGAWTVANLARFGRDLRFAIAPPPRPARVSEGLEREGKDPRVSWCGGWALAIPATARNRDAAWEFIRFMASTPAQRIWVESDHALARAQGVPFLPNQNPRRDLNEEFYERYVSRNQELDPKFKDAVRTFTALLPVSRFRPVTPVGQRLWNEHVSRTEDALYGQDIQTALDTGARNVQRDLDLFFKPPPGTPIRSWAWFFILYPLLLIGLGVCAYLWDTKRAFRRGLARLFRLRSAREDALIEGARGGYFRRQWVDGLVCVLPWLIGFIVFEGGPMLFSLIISFCEYDILQPPQFTGLHNLTWMFTQDEKFPVSLWNTVFMVLGVPLGMLVSLAVALLLNLKIRGMAAWRTLFYLPAIVPMVASSVLWIQILNPQVGFLNKVLEPVLGLVGMNPPSWLESPLWSKPALILMGLWGAGAGMIVWLAGLKSIDAALYEAAEVDGANEWQKLRHITIPQLTPYIFFNLVMGLIGTFQIFGQAFIMTQGGPTDSTLFYVYHLFNNAFRYGHMGYASAMAWILFLIVLGLTLTQFKLARRWVHYEHE